MRERESLIFIDFSSLAPRLAPLGASARRREVDKKVTTRMRERESLIFMDFSSKEFH
jgi:hypothetical protein